MVRERERVGFWSVKSCKGISGWKGEIPRNSQGKLKLGDVVEIDGEGRVDHY